MPGPVIYAAAYLLLAHPAAPAADVVKPPTQPVAIRLLDCEPNHLTIRWVGSREHHRRHHHHVRQS